MFARLCVCRHMVDAAQVYSFVKLKPLMERPLSIIKGNSTVAFCQICVATGNEQIKHVLQGD